MEATKGVVGSAGPEHDGKAVFDHSRFAHSTTTILRLKMSRKTTDSSTNLFVDQGVPLIFDIGLIEDPDLRDNVKKIVLVGGSQIPTWTGRR